MSDAACEWAKRLCDAQVGALYVHVPFCVRRCAYCDFATAAVPANDPLACAYLRALAAQADELRAAGFLDACRTAYVGGGTPTHVGAEPLRTVVEGIGRCAPVLEELSCEANPESFDAEMACALVDAGVTRLSVGVQSFSDCELAALGRPHDSLRAKRAVHTALEAGLDTSIDLMCAIPMQTDDSWEMTLADAAALGVRHVSVYPLALEEGTPLAVRAAHCGDAYNDPDVQARRMEMAEAHLSAAGLARYEVASYAARGHACAHNIAYWSAVPYLGLGTCAASMVTDTLYRLLRTTCLPQLPPAPEKVRRARLVVTSPTAEIAAHPGLEDLSFEVELLDERQAVAEDLMLGTRMVAGTPQGLLAFAETILGQELWDGVERLVRRGLANHVEDRLVPTQRGWLCGNELFGALWDLSGGPVSTVAVSH